MRATLLALLAAALALAACAPPAVPGPAAGAAAPSDARAASGGAAAPATEALAGSGRVVPVPLDPPRVVRIANSGLAAQAPTFLAIEEGYFAELGLAPEVINLPGTADSIALLSGGQIDVATAAISAAFFNAVARGVAIRMVADHGSYIPGRTTAGLVVRADLVEQQPWRGYQDLKGMKVAVQQPGSLLEYDLELMLRRGGLQRDDIEVVVLSFADIATAFVNHAIDAATYNEPFATQLEQQGVIKKIAYTDDVEPYGIIAGLMFGEPFANDADAARNFMVGYLRGVRRYWDAYDGRADFQAVLDVLQKYTPLKDAALIRKIPPTGQNPAGYLDSARLAFYQDWFAERGLVTQKADLARALDQSFVDYANAVLGPYEPAAQPRRPE
jgi:NitT/TauT family transport system substrate-binding protein